MRLLLVEDDHRTADYIVRGLTEAGHVCDLLGNGNDALFAAIGGSYDVIVADRMLPGLDGLSMVKAARAAGVRTPAIFLTSVGGIDDRVEGLEAGGEGRVITRTMLLERVWDFHFDPRTTVVETHISRLRAKIDKPFGSQLIHTVRNTGYSLHAPLWP